MVPFCELNLNSFCIYSVLDKLRQPTQFTDKKNSFINRYLFSGNKMSNKLSRLKLEGQTNTVEWFRLFIT